MLSCTSIKKITERLSARPSRAGVDRGEEAVLFSTFKLLLCCPMERLSRYCDAPSVPFRGAPRGQDLPQRHRLECWWRPSGLRLRALPASLRRSGVHLRTHRHCCRWEGVRKGG
jgi:hypothetical protein